MTERLYYTDADVLEFDAMVVESRDLGGRHAVVLDRTAFYPTSGGQPHDTGLLAGVPVVDVIDEDDRIAHVLASPLTIGAAARGVVDAARRLDHRQQHTGQHILSAAFERLFSNRTVSFHMGADTSTIDLAREQSADDVERAVDEANRVVWENHAVVVRFAGADEAAAMGLRKPSRRQGELRLVEVPGFDLSACGGTHVARTGAIGLIAVTGTEKLKGGLRLTFVCGGRALRSMRGLRDAVTGSVRALSVLPAELPVAIQKLQADSKATRKRVAALQTALATHEAERLRAEASVAGDATIIAAVLDGWDAAGLKAVASALAAAGPLTVALAAGAPVAVVVARSAPQGAGADDVVREMTGRFGGKGGGTRELAQAGGLSGSPSEVVESARRAIEASRPQTIATSAVRARE